MKFRAVMYLLDKSNKQLIYLHWKFFNTFDHKNKISRLYAIFSLGVTEYNIKIYSPNIPHPPNFTLKIMYIYVYNIFLEGLKKN